MEIPHARYVYRAEDTSRTEIARAKQEEDIDTRIVTKV